MTLRTAEGTLALLALENSQDQLLFETLPGTTVPLWAQLRTGFWTALQGHDFPGGSSAEQSVAPEWGSAAARLGRAFLPSRWDATGLKKEHDLLWIVDGITSYSHQGRSRNWLIGDYLDRYRDSAVLQWRAISDPLPHFPMTRSLDPMAARAGGLARLGRRKVDVEVVRALVAEIAARLDPRLTAKDIDAIAAGAMYSISTGPYLEQQFVRLIERVNPRIAIVEDASYGAHAPLIAALKSRGVRVVEPQHGWIGPTHGAYNFGDAMRHPELARTLPDELLTFGEYWSEGLRFPGVETAIGKPHLESRAAHAPEWHERPWEVLLVSSVTFPDRLTAFALRLREALPSTWTIRFRPHPSERATLSSRYPGLLGTSGIALDENSDLYDSLAGSRAVVGVSSTVLFEALAMKCRVFVRDSPYTDYYVGDIFGPVLKDTDVNELVVSLLDGDATVDEQTLDALWKPDAVSNFQYWARQRLAWR